MSTLTREQRRALEQLRDLTDGADDEVSISVLSSVDWDVQRATELIFGAGGAAPAASSSSRPIEAFDIDDSEQGHYPPRPRQPSSSNTLAIITRPVLSILTFPLHLLSSILRFVFGILRIPIPRFSSLTFYRGGSGSTSGFHRRSGGSTHGGPDKWLRELEEETGAISIGRTRVPKGATSSLDAPGQAGASLTSRGSGNGSGSTHGLEDGRKYLPDFTLCTYEEMLKTCQRDAKIGCVILVSEEHDDVPEFKRTTLTDAAFVKILTDNDILVWGGDVRDREAWSAAEKLQATTYPFVAFVALQPRRSPGQQSNSPSRSGSNTPAPSLTVLSRHQGPSHGDPGPTSAIALTTHLSTHLLPRITPFLQRIHAQQLALERDRHLRAEQDRAFASTAARDKARIESKMAAERAEIETKRMAKEEARLAEERRIREEVERQRKEEERAEWRRWTRRAVVADAPATGPLRIAIRLPSGTRVIHAFSTTATLTSLYAFVDTQFIPAHISPADDPLHPPTGSEARGESALENHISTSDEYWGFRIASAYPRVEIPWKRGTKLGEIEQLKGGGQVVVEAINANVNGGRRSAESSRPASAQVEDDDGYDTEDSE